MSLLYLANKDNVKTCLVEKNTIGSGVTNRTTGKITYLQDVYSKINCATNVNSVKNYYESQKYAIELIKEIIEKEKINCNFQKVISYLGVQTNVNKINREIDIFKNAKIPIKFKNKFSDNFNIKKTIYVEDTFVFHPLKYLNSLKEKLKNHIFENTKIVNLIKKEDYYIAITEFGYKIKTKYIVECTHYPIFSSLLKMPLNTYIEKSYIKAYETNRDKNYSLITLDEPIISVRFHKDNEKIYEMYLSETHKSYSKMNDKEHFKNLIQNDKNNAKYLWSNKDIMTSDSLPIIGAIDDENTHYICTGFNTWGMTNGTLAGKIITDLILKKDSKYKELFSPKRCNKGKVLHYPVNIGSNAISFLKSKICKNKEWYSQNVKFETRNGKPIAIYTDEKGKEHIVYNLCPHLKCSLIFNEIEKTWDCPCHGSRFDIDGKSIEGPANYDITYKE